MKNNSKKVFSAVVVAVGLLIAVDGKSQDRKLPDGSIVYGDGTRRLPNGTIIYKGGTSPNNGNYPAGGNYPGSNGGAVTLPDGTVVYPDGTRSYPNNNRRNRRNNNNGQWLPPGQAKKVYGGNAREYAHGQKRWNGEDHDDDNRGRGGRGEGHHDRD